MFPSFSLKRVIVSPFLSQHEWKLTNLKPCLDPLKSRNVTNLLSANIFSLRNAMSSCLMAHLDSGSIPSRGSKSDFIWFIWTIGTLLLTLSCSSYCDNFEISWSFRLSSYYIWILSAAIWCFSASFYSERSFTFVLRSVIKFSRIFNWLSSQCGEWLWWRLFYLTRLAICSFFPSRSPSVTFKSMTC